MSVINKMLRDLDHRQVPLADTPSAPTQISAPTAARVVSVPGPTARPRTVMRLGLLAVGAATLLGIGWLQPQWALFKPNPIVVARPPVVSPAPPVVVTTPSAVVENTALAGPEVMSQAAAVAADAAKPASRAAPNAMVLRMDSKLSLKRLLETEPAPKSAPHSAPANAVQPAPRNPVPVAIAAPVASSGVASVPSPSHSAASAVIAPPDATQVAQRQVQASKDAIAQAQSLWSAGSREAAIELMQEVVATAERAAHANASSVNTQLLVLPVRELTRMQLAQSHPQAVWDLLVRLEPLLSSQADLWAVRANAAQRLARHQDSVHAYMVALQSRPTEQRWLLGAAVSLAALGQSGSAAEMADKARAVGVVSKDILTYLRQMGVPVKE